MPIQKKNLGKRYDDDFKQTAVRRVANGETLEAVAADMGFYPNSYYAFKKKFQSKSNGHVSTKTKPSKLVRVIAPTDTERPNAPMEVTVSFWVDNERQLAAFVHQMIELGLELRIKRTPEKSDLPSKS